MCFTNETFKCITAPARTYSLWFRSPLRRSYYVYLCYIRSNSLTTNLNNQHNKLAHSVLEGAADAVHLPRKQQTNWLQLGWISVSILCFLLFAICVCFFLLLLLLFSAMAKHWLSYSYVHNYKLAKQPCLLFCLTAARCFLTPHPGGGASPLRTQRRKNTIHNIKLDMEIARKHGGTLFYRLRLIFDEEWKRVPFIGVAKWPCCCGFSGGAKRWRNATDAEQYNLFIRDWGKSGTFPSCFCIVFFSCTLFYVWKKNIYKMFRYSEISKHFFGRAVYSVKQCFILSLVLSPNSEESNVPFSRSLMRICSSVFFGNVSPQVIVGVSGVFEL